MSQLSPIPIPSLFYTNLNSVRVSVYGSLDGEFNWSDGWRIEGNVYGPHCKLSDTLPARIKLQDLGDGDSLLSTAIVPDPCPWSAELPATYKVTTNITKNNDVIQINEQQIAFKTLATNVTKLELTDLNGFTKRWVLRAAAGTVDSALSDGGEQCRELRLSRVIVDPDFEDCSQATAEGLWIVAVLNQSGDALQKNLISLSQWPCIACCLLPAETDLGGIDLPNHLLCAAYITDNQELPSWAELIFADASDPTSFNARWSSSVIPVVAHQLTDYNNDREARKMCAAIQAGLAPHTSYAGYIVSDRPLYLSQD